MTYNPYQIALYLLRKIYQKLIKTRNNVTFNVINDADTVSQLLYEQIIKGEPLMVSRFGAVEISATKNYIGIIKKSHNIFDFISGKQSEWWWNEGIRYCMLNNAGFFPNDNQSLEKFGELMLRDMSYIDILASWQKDEVYFLNHLPHTQFIRFIYLDPYWSKTPWTKALENKKILVVHPFASEIEYQYRHNRARLHQNPDTLPLFTLYTLKSVQSIGGNKNYASWFDALDYMKSEIDKFDYDICLLGCGAYGMPLAAHIKRKGKIAIHFGGSLQLLFGIKGKRWETTEYGKSAFSDGIGHYPELMNKYWIRPYSTSKFNGAEKVEGGCYW